MAFHSAQAQALLLKSEKTNYRTGDSFQVTLSIDTGGQPINTVAGKIIVPPDKFQIIDIRSGISILSLWIEKPTADHRKGEISFSGGVPGGYGGSNGPIFNFGILAKKAGLAAIDLRDVQILLNDGSATELTGLTLGKLTLSISEGGVSPAEVYTPSLDNIPPESFVPLVSRQLSIADNKYFISFSAVDKDSGIDYYEVREEPIILNWFTGLGSVSWTKADSPYVLKRQFWAYKILVRAYDQSGNYTEGTVIKPPHPYFVWILMIICGLASILALRRFKKFQWVQKNTQ